MNRRSTLRTNDLRLETHTECISRLQDCETNNCSHNLRDNHVESSTRVPVHSLDTPFLSWMCGGYDRKSSQRQVTNPQPTVLRFRVSSPFFPKKTKQRMCDTAAAADPQSESDQALPRRCRPGRLRQLCHPIALPNIDPAPANAYDRPLPVTTRKPRTPVVSSFFPLPATNRFQLVASQ